jgi:predicted ATP-dependent serine protease
VELENNGIFVQIITKKGKIMTKTRQKVKTVRLRDCNFPPEVFIPLKTGKFIDNVISKKNGTMPATITVVVGEPGSGKTTLLVDKLASIEVNNPDKKCLYISSEMNPIDNMELAEELPQLMGIEGFYLADYENPKEALEDILMEGWDYVIMDSFMDVKDKVKDSDGCKMSGTAVETWLIGLLVSHTKGQNDENKYTAFDVIQHITKGGTYAGSTKLKHNTTAMMFVRVDQQTNERYLVYTKNRRGDINKKLYITLGEEGLDFNSKKYNELEKALKIQKEMDKFQESGEDALADLLSSSEFNVDEKSIVAAVTGINGSDTEKSVENLEEIES